MLLVVLLLFSAYWLAVQKRFEPKDLTDYI